MCLIWIDKAFNEKKYIGNIYFIIYLVGREGCFVGENYIVCYCIYFIISGIFGRCENRLLCLSSCFRLSEIFFVVAMRKVFVEDFSVSNFLFFQRGWPLS